MTLTLFGLVILAIAPVLLLRHGPLALLVFVLSLSLMGGSAAVVLPALSGSSIPPATLALAFLVLRIIMPDQLRRLGPSVQQNAVFVIYAAYAVLGALFLPRIFQGSIEVAPMRVLATSDIYATVPLRFTSQNITQSFYLLGSVCTAIAAGVAFRQRGAAMAIASTAIAIGAIHFALGFADIAFGRWLGGFFDFFRNGSYSQTDHRVAGFSRVNGILPEASAYARFGFIWFVFLAELWLRGIKSKQTGGVALALAAILLFSFSSTAILSLSLYGVIFAFRTILLRGVSVQQVASLSFVIGLIAVLVSGVVLFNPALVDTLSDIFARLTVEKAETKSGQQRLFWTLQGLEAFAHSWGLGIGAGSFRSSSIITAVAGSCGVIGVVCFLIYCWQIIQPLRAETYLRCLPRRQAVAMAAAWGSLGAIIPALFASGSPDPGLLFGAFAGIALAGRSPHEAFETVRGRRLRLAQADRGRAPAAGPSTAPLPLPPLR